MSDARHWLTSSIGLCAVLGIASACPFIEDPNHCANMTTSPCSSEQVCDPCTPSSQNNGCVAPGEAVNNPDCQQAGTATSVGPTESGPDITTTIDPTGMTSIDLDTTVTDDGMLTTTTGDTECQVDGMYGAPCPEDTPFCVDGVCTPCSNDDPAIDCEGEAPETACASDGRCVECTAADTAACGVNMPLCIENVCTACTAHDQCPEGAGCHIFEGRCLPSDRVFTVDPTVPCGQPGQPYCEIGDALAAASAGTEATIRIATEFYSESAVITSNAVVAIIGEGPMASVISGTGGSPAITINFDGVGYLAGLGLENAGLAPGVQSAGDLRMDDATIRDANDGLVSTNGRVHLEDVRVISNDVIGVSLSSAQTATFRNVIIADNGTGSAPRGLVATSTPFTMVYTTVAENAGSNAGAISCTAANAQRTVRNSILVSSTFANAINCEGLTVTTSVVADPDYGDPSNYQVEDFGAGLMLEMFEIVAGSYAEDVAVWLDGDPLFDINGVRRPAVEGSVDAAGANKP